MWTFFLHFHPAHRYTICCNCILRISDKKMLLWRWKCALELARTLQLTCIVSYTHMFQQKSKSSEQLTCSIIQNCLNLNRDFEIVQNLEYSAFTFIFCLHFLTAFMFTYLLLSSLNGLLLNFSPSLERNGPDAAPSI